MRRFEELTARGRIRRLRGVAARALADYDLDIRRVSFVAQYFNTTFRIDLVGGGRRALRVGAAARMHPAGTEEAEAQWIAELRAAGFRVPGVVPTRGGDVLTVAEASGVPERRVCLLFDWVAGRSLTERMTVEYLSAAGRLSAELHDHARSQPGSPRPAVAVADRLLYWGGERRLHLLADHHGTLFTDAEARAEAAVEQIWRRPPHPPHLLHGDFAPQNLMVGREGVTAIDFQDLIWGFDIQDLAITIAALRRYPDPDPLTTAFISGYRQVRSWPDLPPALLDALVAGRRLHQLNLTMNLRSSDDLAPYLARHAAWVSQWMAS